MGKYHARITGQMRHWLGFAGGAVAAGGYADESTVQEIIGGLMALTTLILSFISPAKKVGEGD